MVDGDDAAARRGRATQARRPPGAAARCRGRADGVQISFAPAGHAAARRVRARHPRTGPRPPSSPGLFAPFVLVDGGWAAGARRRAREPRLDRGHARRRPLRRPAPVACRSARIVGRSPRPRSLMRTRPGQRGRGHARTQRRGRVEDARQRLAAGPPRRAASRPKRNVAAAPSSNELDRRGPRSSGATSTSRRASLEDAATRCSAPDRRAGGRNSRSAARRAKRKCAERAAHAEDSCATSTQARTGG